MGNGLLLELEKLEDRRWQKLQKTIEGALSVKLYYSANILRRRVVVKVGGNNNAQTTCSKGSIQVAEGSKTTHKLGSNKSCTEDLIEQEDIGPSVQNGVDFGLVVELSCILLFKFLNTLLLACLIVVQVVGIVVLGVERGLED